MLRTLETDLTHKMQRLVLVVLTAIVLPVLGHAAEQQRPRLNMTMMPIDYPIEALAAAEEGTVLVELGIGIDGAVTDVVLQQSSGSSVLDDAGIAAARGVKLSSPPMRGGVPVAARLPAEIVWKLPLTLAEKYFAVTDPLTRTLDEEIRRMNGGKNPENLRPPRPVGRGNRINANSYPAESVRRNEMGRVTFATHIGVDGSVIETYLVGSSGFDRLDQWATNEVRKFRYEPARLGDVPVASIAMQRLSFTLDGAQLSNCDASPLITRTNRRAREEAGEAVPRYSRWTLINAQGKIDESLLLTEKGWMSLDPSLVAVMNETARLPIRGRPARCWVYDGVDPMMNG